MQLSVLIALSLLNLLTGVLGQRVSGRAGDGHAGVVVPPGACDGINATPTLITTPESGTTFRTATTKPTATTHSQSPSRKTAKSSPSATRLTNSSRKASRNDSTLESTNKSLSVKAAKSPTIAARPTHPSNGVSRKETPRETTRQSLTLKTPGKAPPTEAPKALSKPKASPKIPTASRKGAKAVAREVPASATPLQDEPVNSPDLGENIANDPGHNLTELVKRAAVASVARSCNQPIPRGSPFGAITSTGEPAFRTMKEVLAQAFVDAHTLAEHAEDLDSTSPAFTHYFGGARAATQHDHFKGMMDAIQGTYSIKFTCGPQDIEDCTEKSLMVADASTSRGQKIIQVCPRFWFTDAFFLPADNQPEGGPFRPLSPAGWGIPNQFDGGGSFDSVNFFQTAGHTLLHELTHIDSIARAAGLAADEVGRHGTLDSQEGYSCSRDLQSIGARNYLGVYKRQGSRVDSPDFNAESYAAAATENFFMEKCGYRFIS